MPDRSCCFWIQLSSWHGIQVSKCQVWLLLPYCPKSLPALCLESATPILLAHQCPFLLLLYLIRRYSLPSVSLATTGHTVLHRKHLSVSLTRMHQAGKCLAHVCNQRAHHIPTFQIGAKYHLYLHAGVGHPSSSSRMLPWYCPVVFTGCGILGGCSSSDEQLVCLCSCEESQVVLS